MYACGNLNAIDSTGLSVLKDVVRRFKKDHTRVLLTDVHAQPMIALGRSDFLDEIGEEYLFGSLDAALDAACRHLEARQPSKRGVMR